MTERSPQARYRWYTLLAEANTCHNCGANPREPFHDCPAMRITKVLWDRFQAGRNAV